jgi:hypothetical protein
MVAGTDTLDPHPMASTNAVLTPLKSSDLQVVIAK